MFYVFKILQSYFLSNEIKEEPLRGVAIMEKKSNQQNAEIEEKDNTKTSRREL